MMMLVLVPVRCVKWRNDDKLLILAHFSTFLVPFPSQPKAGDFIRPSPVVAPFLPYRL